MRTAQRTWTADRGWSRDLDDADTAAQLVLAFGSTSLVASTGVIDEIRAAHPEARLVGCSTAGEISGTQVSDDSLVVTAVRFERASVATASTYVSDATASYAAGRKLADSLPLTDLVHVLVFSDGLKVNGSDLTRGLTDELPARVTVTGGMSGDGARFSRTLVLCDGPGEPDKVVVVGLYGPGLSVGHGSLGGWDPFGPERLITRARGNVLLELDGRPALDLYVKYLGEHASSLPATGLLFPLCVRSEDGGRGVVRTILAVDEAERSLTFAGDVPEGSLARLMKANVDRLIDGAVGAARTSREALGAFTPQLALLINCVGRKLVLQQRVDEEVEGVRDIVGPDAGLTGFYSYGEISPFAPGARCELHNQTMTVTTLAEAAR